MAKAPSGWRGHTVAHSNARKYGRAGNGYKYASSIATPKSSFRLQYKELEPKHNEYLKGGLADGLKDTAFNYEQLQKGMKVEMEHTSNSKIAREIAKDHLREDPNYYEKLDKMEKSPDNFLENTMSLPVQFSITIPSTQDINTDIGKRKMDERTEKVKKWLVDKFYGDTTILGKGDYDSNGKLVQEDVAVIQVSTTPESFKEHKKQLGEYVKKLRESYGQKQMAYNIEGDLYLYPRDPKKPFIKHIPKEQQK